MPPTQSGDNSGYRPVEPYSRNIPANPACGHDATSICLPAVSDHTPPSASKVCRVLTKWDKSRAMPSTYTILIACIRNAILTTGIAQYALAAAHLTPRGLDTEHPGEVEATGHLQERRSNGPRRKVADPWAATAQRSSCYAQPCRSTAEAALERSLSKGSTLLDTLFLYSRKALSWKHGANHANTLGDDQDQPLDCGEPPTRPESAAQCNLQHDSSCIMGAAMRPWFLRE